MKWPFGFRSPQPTNNAASWLKSKYSKARSQKAKEALDAIPALLRAFSSVGFGVCVSGDFNQRVARPKSQCGTGLRVLLERIRQERKARFIEDAAEKARAKAQAKAEKASKPWTNEDNAACLERERTKAKEIQSTRARGYHRPT